jgi:hypothetical protein
MKKVSKEKFMEIMRIKAGILVRGIFFTDQVLSILYNENKLVKGTGLFNYNESGKNKIRSLGLAPNEIILQVHDTELRVEVRSRSDSTQTPYNIYFDDGAGFCFKDCQSGDVFPVRFPDPCSYFNLTTANGQSMINVARLMGSSILRIYPDMRCDFAEVEAGRCRFCNTFYGKPKVEGDLIIKDTMESIKKAAEEINLQGIFMSTGAFFSYDKISFFSALLEEIKINFPEINIVFSLAPQKDLEKLRLLYDGGGKNLILSFNMEVYDHNKWIPGKINCFGDSKAKLGRDYYFSAYQAAVSIGGVGSVKSNFVLGLESLKSLSRGITRLSKMGVSSSGTIFYPTPGAIWTNLGYDPRSVDFKKDPVTFVVEAYLLIAQAIIDYDLKIGWNSDSRISGLEWDAFNYLTC